MFASNTARPLSHDPSETMGDDRSADKSSVEIRTLLRKLHPDKGNHKDRIRRLNKFRNYVLGDSKSGQPEFYDDDIPLFFLGDKAPAAFLDPEDDTIAGLYGLLQACGTPSGDHDGTLKRSARHAMNLLKWILLDWKEKGQKKDALNLFATSFCSLPVRCYQYMQLGLHVRGDERGGAKEDACQIIVLLLTRHLSEDGESPKPIMLEELVSSPQAQQEFDIWSARHVSASTQDKIKKNAAARQSELAMQQRQDALAHKAMGGLAEDFEDDSENAENTETDDVSENTGDDDGFGGDDVDVMAAFRKRKKDIRKELKQAEKSGELTASHGVALRWEDSQLAREQRARAASAARAGQHETVRDSQEAAQEAAEREEEKAKVLAKDPLGIVNDENFDLTNLEKSQAEQMEQAIHELQEQIQKAESLNSESARKKALAQKEALEAFLERVGGLEALENPSNLQHSVLPSSPKFNPLLFLTLVHRTASVDKLHGSMARLTNKIENQAEQLQNLVRENFPLFVRCAEGFEQFRQSSETAVGAGVNDRVEKLDAIAESCAYQAKKSFKPLLDNTSEVRKVQSAMAVLQRVAPILQVPALMRQHIENRRYSQAIKTYRRALIIDGNCKIELLKHVKTHAEDCVREARCDLERRLAQDSATIDDLMDGIRDLSELLELDVPQTLLQEDTKPEDKGLYEIGGSLINVRDHPPALGCLLLQAAHFAAAVKNLIKSIDETTGRIFIGESGEQIDQNFSTSGTVVSMMEVSESKSSKGSGNQWKYDVLDARVLSTVKAVKLAQVWLPRLIQVGRAAREDERRRAARIGARRKQGNLRGLENSYLTAFEVFVSNITPFLTNLVEHSAFCALGSNARTSGKEVRMTFGQSFPEKLRVLLCSPLPPSQSTKVGKELAELVELLSTSSGGAASLRPDDGAASIYQLSPLDECKAIGDAALLTIEKRRCIYAFDVCARGCSNKASGSGKFDAESLLHCIRNLAEQLSRPEECGIEVEKGCEDVVRRCCEGLASYVRDRGDSARLGAVAECADVMSERLDDLLHEIAAFTKNGDRVSASMLDDILGLESAMFDEYLDNVRQDVLNSVKISWLDMDNEGAENEVSQTPIFPAYLSISLLAIVRCRAQVEQALGTKVRHSEGSSYQHLAVVTAADGVVEGICNDIAQRKLRLKVRQADRLANELEFLKSTLKRVLSNDSKALLDSTLHMVCTKAGRGRDYQGDGPDGLAALEELERLGRVYVLCLGD